MGDQLLHTDVAPVIRPGWSASRQLAKHLTFVFILFAPVTSALAEPNQMLCSVESGVGLHYDAAGGAWQPRRFGGGKYVLRKINPGDRNKPAKWATIFQFQPKANWAFFEAGEVEPMPLAFCTHDPSESGGPPTPFECTPNKWGTAWYDAAFDPKTLRFEIVFHGSYINQGFNARLKQSDPDTYLKGRAEGWVADPDKPDDLVLEIGKCSPD